MEKKIAYLFIIINCLTANIEAQFTFNYQELKEKYSRFNGVFLEKKVDVVIDIVKDSVVAKQHTREQLLILSEHSKMFSNDKIFSSSFTRVENIDAKIYVPSKNGKYKTVKVTEFNEIDDIDSYVFYDDSKSVIFTFPAIQEQAITSLDYDMIFLDSRFLRSFFFKSGIPVLKTSLNIKVNKNIELKYKGFHLEGFNYKFSKTEKGDYIYYTWEAENLDEFKSGSRLTGITHYSPHIVYYVGQINVNGILRNHYGTVDDLYDFYFNHIENVDTSCTEELKKKVNEITAGITSEEEKVKQILYWVRKNIKYVAFEHGLRGFIPDHGYNVYNKKYGDCKDMSTLIITMLNCAGIKAHLTLVGTRHIPYSFEELPLPKANHMIAVYLKNEDPVILDGTITYLTFGYPPYLLQDKEMLVSFDEENYKIYKIPVLPSEKSKKQSEFEIKISGDTLIGEGNTSYIGYNRSEISYALSGVKNSDIRKKLIRILSVGSNKFNLVDYNIDNPDNEELPVIIDYRFKVPGYLKSIDGEIYINLSIDKSYSDYAIDTSMVDAPMENDFYFHEKHITKLEIPEGYVVEHLPENVSFKNEKFSFNITYKNEGKKLIQERNIVFEFLLLQKEEFNIWNEMITQLVGAYRESVVLKKINNN